MDNVISTSINMKKKTSPIIISCSCLYFTAQIQTTVKQLFKKEGKKKSIQLVQIVSEEDNVMLSFLNHDKHDWPKWN